MTRNTMPTVSELKTKLDDLGVEYGTTDKKVDLEKLLAAFEEKIDEEEKITEEVAKVEEEARLVSEDTGPAFPPAVAAKEEGDYLVKYQYKKQTPFGTLATNPAPGSKADFMKKGLLKQPRVRIMIPKANKSDSFPLSVTLNGYRLDLPKQTYVEVPQQVAEVVMDNQTQTQEALKPFRIDGDRPAEALS